MAVESFPELVGSVEGELEGEPRVESALAWGPSIESEVVLE